MLAFVVLPMTATGQHATHKTGHCRAFCKSSNKCLDIASVHKGDARSCTRCDSSMACYPGAQGWCELKGSNCTQSNDKQQMHGYVDDYYNINAAAGKCFQSNEECAKEQQVVHDTIYGAPVQILPAGSVTASLTVGVDIADISGNERTKFNSSFQSDVATLVNISAYQIKVSAISSGSAIVGFNAVPNEQTGVPVQSSALLAAFPGKVQLPTLNLSTEEGISALVVQSGSPFRYTELMHAYACGQRHPTITADVKFALSILEDKKDVTTSQCADACTAAGAGCIGFSFTDKRVPVYTTMVPPCTPFLYNSTVSES